jgi:hypothetical protein
MNPLQARWLAIGFLLAPLTAGVSWFTLGAVFGGFNDWTDALVSIVVVYVFSFPVIAVIGSASLALAHRAKIAYWWVALIVGLTSGALVGASFNQQGAHLVEFAITGAIPAVFIWWCWRSANLIRMPRHGT